MVGLKQKIRIEGKCIEDIFNLPCIVGIEKYPKGGGYFYKLSDNSYAQIGDWLCEDYYGCWHVYTNEQINGYDTIRRIQNDEGL